MITAVGAPAIAWAPGGAAIIATIIRSTEDMPDTHRLTAPPLPGDQHRPFRVAPEATDFRFERWCSIGKTPNEMPGT